MKIIIINALLFLLPFCSWHFAVNNESRKRVKSFLNAIVFDETATF